MNNTGRLGLTAATLLAISITLAGCHNTAQDQTADAAANGNLAPVSDNSAAAPATEAPASPSMPLRTSNSNHRSIRIKVRTTTIRVTTRSRITPPNLHRLCRNTSSRHARTRIIFGRPATGPMLRRATTGFREFGPPLLTLVRYGRPATGALSRGAMDGIVGIGDATSATTAA
jgi:hypothetical protein